MRGYEQRPVRCNRCQLLMVLDEGDVLPLHWPQGKLCVGAGTKEWAKEKS